MPITQHETEASPVAGEIELWPQLKLSPQHEKQWSEFKACMLWAVPSFSDIWLSMMVDKYCDHAWFTDQMSTAATDDKYLYINPSWFFALTLDEQLFVACHEVEHAMYGHAGLGWILSKEGKIRYNDGVSIPYHGDTMNIAMDYVINAQLVEAKIGKMPEHGCLWPGVINGDMGVLDAYRIVYKRYPPGKQPNPGSDNGKDAKGGAGGANPNLPGKPFDKLLRPGQGRGKTASKAVSERSQTEWDSTVTAAMESAKLRGQLPANLDRAFTKRIQPKADWRDLFALALSRKIGNGRYTWGTLDPQLAYRGIGSPGRVAFGCDLAVIVIDTSGSINQRTFDVFMAEATALMEQCKPKRIIFAQCDTDIQEWLELDASSDLYECKLKRGGGTSFRAPFERIDKEGLEPDIMVYLTDLYGDQNEIPEPPYPVVWGCVTDEDAKWGEIVRVPPQAEDLLNG
jgi:predicted metal-dependent peptidase